jgi:hypothetical protein
MSLLRSRFFTELGLEWVIWPQRLNIARSTARAILLTLEAEGEVSSLKTLNRGFIFLKKVLVCGAENEERVKKR